ncbi:hypothetical protein [Endozoicomonas euniceicola]|uniref:Uncharacterized protein n=1 Tax=Endozoicomonas euniceicola TaxID=1234143 RepID=A0ABY6GVG5_9GAMM|nr:hypothetical protein [Endozoicomonas euniceicola]UYM16066.1 hypothetical protein NX720_25220 [Endozoicomonas euniceicola]
MSLFRCHLNGTTASPPMMTYTDFCPSLYLRARGLASLWSSHNVLQSNDSSMNRNIKRNLDTMNPLGQTTTSPYPKANTLCETTKEPETIGHESDALISYTG